MIHYITAFYSSKIRFHLLPVCLCVLPSSGGTGSQSQTDLSVLMWVFPAWIWSTVSAEETAVTGTMIGDTKRLPHTDDNLSIIGEKTDRVTARKEWDGEEKKKREEIELRKGCKHWVNTCLLWNGKQRAAPTVALVTPWECDCWQQRHTEVIVLKQTFARSYPLYAILEYRKTFCMISK